MTQMSVSLAAGQPAQSLVPSSGLAPPNPQAPTAPVGPTEDQWLQAPDQAWQVGKNQLRTELTQTVGQQVTGLYEAQAQIARNQAALADPDAFNRWGPEIDMTLNQIPPQQRTPDIVAKAVALVKGNHAAEIQQEALNTAVEEEIKRRTAAGALRSGGDGSGLGGSETPTGVLDYKDERIPADRRQRWQQAGIDQNTVVAFATKMYPGLMPDQAVEKYLAEVRTVEVSDD